MDPRLQSALSGQGEFNFEGSKAQDGYTRWLDGRRVLAEELARRVHLPIGHEVEVWLFGGIRLRGLLKVREEMVFIEEERLRHLELMVDHVTFTYRDMESCIRMD